MNPHTQNQKLKAILTAKATVAIAFSVFTYCLTGCAKISGNDEKSTIHKYTVACQNHIDVEVSVPNNVQRDAVLCENGDITWKDRIPGEPFRVEFTTDGTPFPNQSLFEPDSSGKVTSRKAPPPANLIMSYKYTLTVHNHPANDPHVIVLGSGGDEAKH
jgi:hypothetical protein